MEPDLRVFDADRDHEVRSLRLYLTPVQVATPRDKLENLLSDPEAPEHLHVSSADMSRDLSCLIVTSLKLKSGGYA